MWKERLARYLLPGEAERDPEFRSGIQALAHIGLYVVGGVEVTITAFMIVTHMLLDPSDQLAPLRLGMGASIVGIGLITLACARLGVRNHAREVAIASGLATAAVLISALLLMTGVDRSADDFLPGNLTLVMLVAVAAVPLRPSDILLTGFLLECIYVIAAYAVREFYGAGDGVEPLYVLFIFMLTCLATALTALLYEQRRSTYEWHRSALLAADNLRQAESRNLLAENAASVGRLAAALSHELNTPLGALISGVDTLLLLAGRQATAPPEQQQRLVILQNELRKSVKASTDRLKEIIQRTQRFTNLDKAEIQAANVNDILSDVKALLEPRYRGKAEVEMDLKPVPELVCRPQQLSAVFSNLLGNAIEASDGTGRVRVSTSGDNANIEVTIEDNGRGLEQSELDSIFDPGFKVNKGRVTTGNWSMFSSRQIVREHGGDIVIESRPGEGTRVRVKLPSAGAGLKVS